MVLHCQTLRPLRTLSQGLLPQHEASCTNTTVTVDRCGPTASQPALLLHNVFKQGDGEEVLRLLYF